MTLPTPSSALVVTSLALFGSSPGAGVAAAPPPKSVNVTGSWNTDIAGGPDLYLHQEGNAVWGRDHNGFLVRGTWSEGRLVLFYRSDFKEELVVCSAPVLVVMKSSGTATRLEGVEFRSDGQVPAKVFVRASPEPGADFGYPYAAELKGCGSLPTEELAFAVDSDRLEGTEWPLLGSIAAMLKSEAGLKIRVLGHTDSTGDPARNKDLSQRRADAVKKVLVERYGADAERIATRGWGDEQPLVSNDTAEGRALNRRVEITLAR